MKLKSKYFNLTKNNHKTIEIRLNDEKRKLFNIGDTITFLNSDSLDEQIYGIIDKIDYFSSIEELINLSTAQDLGIHKKKKKIFIHELSSIYSDYDVKKYGVLGIKFHLI